MLKWQGPILQIMFLKFPSWWFFTNPLEKYAQIKMDIFPFRKENRLNQPSIIVFDVHRNRGVFFEPRHHFKLPKFSGPSGVQSSPVGRKSP